MLKTRCGERSGEVSAGAPRKQTGNYQPGSDFSGTHQEKHPLLALQTMMKGHEKTRLDWELGATLLGFGT